MSIDIRDYQPLCSPEATTFVELAVAFPRRDSRIQVVTFVKEYPRIAILEQSSGEPVGITAHKGLFFLAWQSTDAPGQINLTWSKDGLFSSGEDERNKVVFNDTAAGGVSLASYKDRLFMAWRGGGGLGSDQVDGRINIAWSSLPASGGDATHLSWPSENRLVLPNRCYTKPSLCPAYTGFRSASPQVIAPTGQTSQNLYIFWVDDNNLNIYFQRCIEEAFGDLALEPGRVKDDTKMGIYKVNPGGSTTFMGEASDNPWIASQQSYVTSTFNWDTGEIYLGGLQPYLADPSIEDQPYQYSLIWLKCDGVLYPDWPVFHVFSTAQTSNYAPAVWQNDIVWTGTDGNQSLNIAPVSDVII